MDVKLKVAIAVAALLGATTVGEFIVISQLRVQVATQQSDVAHRQAVVKAEAHAMKDFLSGKQPPGQHL